MRNDTSDGIGALIWGIFILFSNYTFIQVLQGKESWNAMLDPLKIICVLLTLLIIVSFVKNIKGKIFKNK